MKVSIITSAYNCENYIEEMLDSIIGQTYTEWEMILVDDSSNDGTWDIIERIKDDRIVKIRNQTNIGLTKNLNMALDIAEGKYIIRMDADDIAMPERIAKQVQFMEMNPDIVLSGCWMQCFGEIHDITKVHLNDDDIRIDSIFNSAIMHPTFIIRNDVLKKYSIKYNEKLKYAQDYDLTYQISRFGKLSNIPEVLVKYRTHSSQIGSAYKDQQRGYADITRKKIIEDMGIRLGDNEFGVWSDFCLGKTDGYSEEEKRILTQITRCLISNNQLKSAYDSRKLERILSRKMQTIIAPEEKNEKDQVIEKEKYRRLFSMMCRWMQLKQRGKSVVEWLSLRNYKNIAIYGMGDVGECLAEELKNSSIRIMYGIDSYSEIRCSLRKMITPDDKFEKVDAIIITAIIGTDNIKKLLSKRISCPFVSIEDIIYDIGL